MVAGPAIVGAGARRLTAGDDIGVRAEGALSGRELRPPAQPDTDARMDCGAMKIVETAALRVDAECGRMR